ncbi:MAG: hypothetical protein H0W62_08750 [Chitinophagales bacterium]|nr:hypothetical protein [Chitinophagales bacterium]
MDPILIPILVPLAAFAMIFGIVYLSNKERMLMIEKGMDPRSKQHRPLNSINSLKGGLIFLGVGIGLMIAFFLTNYSLPNTEDSEAIYFSMIGIGGGLGLVISYLVERNDEKKHL